MSRDVIHALQTPRLDALDKASTGPSTSGDKMTADELLERMEDLDKVAS